jgi:hypothetical protein
MQIYVLLDAGYEGSEVVEIFSSLEDAMSYYQIPKEKWKITRDNNYFYTKGIDELDDVFGDWVIIQPRTVVERGYDRCKYWMNKRLARVLECHGDIFNAEKTKHGYPYWLEGNYRGLPSIEKLLADRIEAYYRERERTLMVCPMGDMCKVKCNASEPHSHHENCCEGTWTWKGEEWSEDTRCPDCVPHKEKDEW